MALQPLIIHKTKSYKPVATRRFRSTAEAKKWLRSEGCKFPNRDLDHIGDDCVELLTENYEYSIEVALTPQRRKHNG